MNLFDAAARGDMDTIRSLLDAGADIDQAFDSGLTALTTAAFHGRSFAVEYLVKRGANLEKYNDNGVSPLISAARESRRDIVVFLVASGAMLEHADKQGMTALLTAANHADLDTVRALLEVGADPLARSINGSTVLALAVLNNTPRYGQIEAMKLFLEAGVDVNATTQWGTSAYSLALERKMEDKIAFLREVGAAPNTTESPWMKEARLEKEAAAIAAPQPRNRPATQKTDPPRRHWWQFWK